MLEQLVPIYFGQAVRRLRINLGFTQEKLGEEAGLQRNFISSLELGHKQPSLLTVFKIARALSIGADDLVKEVADRINDHDPV